MNENAYRTLLDPPIVAAVIPLFRITGLCHAGQHRFCQGRVYQGHDGIRSVYLPCDCTCHTEPEAKAA